MTSGVVVLLFALAALAAAQPCPSNPVMAVTSTDVNTCAEGSLTIRGKLDVDFDVRLGTNGTNMILMNGAVILPSTHVLNAITPGTYNMTAAELFEGFIYTGASSWGDALAVPKIADIKAYMTAHGITALEGMFLPKIYVGLGWTSSGDLTITTQDTGPIPRFGPAVCSTPDSLTNDYSWCTVHYVIGADGTSDGAYGIEDLGAPTQTVDAWRSKIMGGSDVSVTTSKMSGAMGGQQNVMADSDRSVMLGGGGVGVRNSITNSDNSATVGGHSNTVPAFMDDAVLLGGSGLTARGPGAMTTDMYVEGVLYSNDVTGVAEGVTITTQNGSMHLVAQVGHKWNNDPETDLGEFRVIDSSTTVAFAVNNWGAAVFHMGSIVQGQFLDVLSIPNILPMTADRVAVGFTYYRKGVGDPTFGLELPPAAQFEQLLGTAGTPCPLGVRFLPIYIVNRSPTFSLLFQLPASVSAVWSPSTPFINCPIDSLCKVELTTVGSSAGAVTFLIAVETVSVA